MPDSKNPSRRRFVMIAGAAITYSALPKKAAAAKTSPPAPSPFAIPDYTNNPFLRPIGGPHTPNDPVRPTPTAISGNGVDG